MESQNNPPVKNQRFLPAPFTQGGLYAAGRPYLRVDTLREEQGALPAYEERFYRGVPFTSTMEGAVHRTPDGCG